MFIRSTSRTDSCLYANHPQIARSIVRMTEEGIVWLIPPFASMSPSVCVSVWVSVCLCLSQWLFVFLCLSLFLFTLVSRIRVDVQADPLCSHRLLQGEERSNLTSIREGGTWNSRHSSPSTNRNATLVQQPQGRAKSLVEKPYRTIKSRKTNHGSMWALLNQRIRVEYRSGKRAGALAVRFLGSVFPYCRIALDKP